MWTTELLKWIGGGASIGAILSLYTLIDNAAKPTEFQQKLMNSEAENSAIIVQKMENQGNRQAQLHAAMQSAEWQNIQTMARELDTIKNAEFSKFQETFRQAFQNYVQKPTCNYSAIHDGLQWCADYASRGAARWLGIARPHSCTIENAQKLRADCGLR